VRDTPSGSLAEPVPSQELETIETCVDGYLWLGKTSLEFPEPKGKMNAATIILIGDLLVRGEMTTPRDMADAVPISLKTGLPIGRVLIGAAALTEAKLQQALLAQSLIRDSLLSVDLAVQALRIVVREGFNLEQALRIVGWQPETFLNENRLGQLLLSAEVITEAQLEQALKIFYTAGLPLARVLVLRGLISNIVAYAALSSQQLLRDNKLSREQAVQCVRAAMTSGATIEDNYVNGYLRMQPGNTVRLGEILVLANIASETDVMVAVEEAITRAETLGEVLVKRGFIRDDELERALEAQRLVTKGLLDSAKAGDVLKKANYERSSVADALNNHAPAQLVRAVQVSDIDASKKSGPPSLFNEQDRSWLAEVEAATRGGRQRTDEETRARLLSSRLLQKIDALFTRNTYLKNILDKDRQDEVDEDREELDELKAALERAVNFDECMDLADKLMAKVETFAYHTGYLRSRLDTVSAQLEMVERVRDAEESAAAWKERAGTVVSNPAVLVGRQDNLPGSASAEALASTLAPATLETSQPEPFILAHDVLQLVSPAVAVKYEQTSTSNESSQAPAKAKAKTRKKKR